MGTIILVLALVLLAINLTVTTVLIKVGIRMSSALISLLQARLIANKAFAILWIGAVISETLTLFGVALLVAPIVML